VSRLLLLQEGFRRLLRHYKPHVACEKIEEALRENRLRLYCNGKLLPVDYIKTELRVVI
jgi:hypothetical protein